MHPGSKLQEDISDILLWSRIHRILFSADIVKMFRQIAVHRDDWDLQSIFWYGQNEQPAEYCLITVIYGSNCAPFLALRTLKQLIEDEGHRFLKAVIPLSRGRYVDDIFGGAESVTEVKEIIHQLIELCRAGGFPLQKWSSNYPGVLPSTFTENTTATVEIESTLQKILGLVWRPTSDTFHFRAHLSSDTKATKRSIASEIAKLYDPLGLISHVLIQAKLILQELWLLKITWDEALPPEIVERWATFLKYLLEIDKLSIPRWLGPVRTDSFVEVHSFSDASHFAMAAAVYLRTHLRDNEYSAMLVCSKTKVAPLKRLTIPRLELTAALLLT